MNFIDLGELLGLNGQVYPIQDEVLFKSDVTLISCVFAYNLGEIKAHDRQTLLF